MGSIAGIDGQVCSTAELGLSVASPGNQYPNITCLTRGQSIGLAFLAQAGCISFVSVLIIYVLIIRNILRHRNHGSWKLLKRPADIYVLSLISLDAIQAWGQILSAYWVMTGKVYAGSFCTAQGLLQQFGETGVAVTSLTITLSTFINVFWRKGIHNRTFAFFVVSITWLFSTLWVIVGASTHDNPEAPYINPTPYWCWINARYFGERVGGEYFWLWTALLASILLYPPIYLWSNGNLSVDARFWWRFHYHQTPPKLNIQGRRRRAFTILAYPAAYSIVVLPVSVIRFTGFGLEARGQSIPSIVTFISITLFALSGAMNVLLLITTRPNLLLFGHPQGEKDDDAMGFASDMMITLVTITQERITAEHPRELSLPLGRVKSALAHSDVDDDDDTMTMVESSEGHIFDSSSSEGV